MMRTSESRGFRVRKSDLHNLNFELKGQFFHILKETSFAGKDYEDAIWHVENFIKIVEYFNISNAFKDQIMLRVFPITPVVEAKD